MLDILITDTNVLKPHAAGVDRHMSVGVENGKIAFVRPFEAQDRTLEAAERIDGTWKLVMPGLVDCHTHTG